MSSREGLISSLPSPPQNEPLKSPPRLRLTKENKRQVYQYKKKQKKNRLGFKLKTLKVESKKLKNSQYDKKTCKNFQRNIFFIDFVISFGVTSWVKVLLKQQKLASKPPFLKY